MAYKSTVPKVIFQDRSSSSWRHSALFEAVVLNGAVLPAKVSERPLRRVGESAKGVKSPNSVLLWV